MRWLRRLLRKRALDNQLDSELRFHVEQQIADNIAAGMNPAEARRRALAQFGGVEYVKEECREARGTHFVEALLQDLRYAFRMLRKSPGFTAVVVLTLALGIGANTAIFSIVNGVLLRPLEFPQPERLMRITNSYPEGAFLAMRSDLHTMDVATYWEGTEFNLTGLGNPVRLDGSSVSAEFFSALGVKPTLGRVFLAGEDHPSQDNVVVLSQALWRDRFGSDVNVIGRSITLEGISRQIVGVMPASFQFLSPKTQLWVPLHLDTGNLGALFGGPFLPVIGRLRAGATLEQAHAELQQFAPRVVSMFPWKMPDNWKSASLISLQQDFVGEVQTKLLVLLGAIGLVLLIACANVANLLLSRAATRQREMALRAALGAGRWRICRQLLTESTILAILGGAFGMLLSVNGLAWLKAILPADTPRLATVTLDWRVLVFTAVVALLTGVIFGLAPALHASKIDLTESLKIGGQHSAAMGVSHRLRSVLAITEIALAVMLVTGAGLMVKSLWVLSHVNLGFQTESIVTARITPNESFCANFARCLGFYNDLVGRVRALPGVERAALVSVLPLNGRVDGFAADLEDHPRAADNSAPMIFETVITPDYLRLMGIPLLQGRAFTTADESPGAPPVALVSASTARKYWPNQSAVGKHIKPVFVDTWMKIVGVVADVNEYSVAAKLPSWADGAVYDAYGNASLLTPRHGRQQPTEMTLVVRTSNSQVNYAGLLRRSVAGLNPEVPVSEVQTLRAIASESVSAPRSTMSLFAIFAALALVLGAVGIYGVVSYSMVQRTSEIGIRLALGAQRRDVLHLVVAYGLRLAFAGVVAGIAGALAATRAMSSLLYGVSATDPLTFIAVAILLAAVTLAACYIPARRAMKVDPMVALRYE
jgi:putative ABC transport system permease protein